MNFGQWGLSWQEKLGIKWGAQVRVTNEHLNGEPTAARATDVISTSNPQTCFRLPRPAAVISVTLEGVHIPTHTHSGRCMLHHHMLRLLGVTPISPHVRLTEQAHTFQNDLLMRKTDGQMSVCYQLMLCHRTVRPEAQIHVITHAILSRSTCHFTFWLQWSFQILKFFCLKSNIFVWC